MQDKLLTAVIRCDNLRTANAAVGLGPGAGLDFGHAVHLLPRRMVQVLCRILVALPAICAGDTRDVSDERSKCGERACQDGDGKFDVGPHQGSEVNQEHLERIPRGMPDLYDVLEPYDGSNARAVHRNHHQHRWGVKTGKSEGLQDTHAEQDGD